MRLEVLITNFVAGRNVSSTCSSSGSALWASAKNIKPLVDANFHTEAIESAYRESPIRFSPIRYQNPGSKSRSPSGQTILFGCPLELCTVGEQETIPPVLAYLLDSVHVWPGYSLATDTVGEQYRSCTIHSLCFKEPVWWTLVNEIEQAWTGVEESDRAIIISTHVHANPKSLILVCLLRCTISKSKWPHRNTFGPSQSQYCHLMIAQLLFQHFPVLRAWLGILGVRTPSRQLFSEPYFPVRLG